MPAMQNIEWKKMLLVVFVLIVGTAIVDYLVLKKGAGRPGSLEPSNKQELRTIVTSQSADGVTDDQLTQEVAVAWERYAADRIASKTTAIAKERDIKGSIPSIKSESVVIQTKNRRLIVVRMLINETARSVEILGIQGETLLRVMCVRESLDEILLTTGSCADQIHETFGVRL